MRTIRFSKEQHAAISAAGEELANLLFPVDEEDANGGCYISAARSNASFQRTASGAR